MITGETIAGHATKNPHGIAIAFDDEVITWCALEDLLKRTAAWITSLSPGHGPVAIHLAHTPALAVIFLAVIRLGREAQILDTQWPRRNCDRLLNKLNPDLVVTADNALKAHKITLNSHALSFETFSALLGNVKPIEPWPVTDPARPFYVGCTSGSTGPPKGYRRNHASWIASFEAAQSEFKLTSGDVILAPGTLTHSLFSFSLCYAMHIGAKCVMQRNFRPGYLLKYARAHNASVLFSVPAQLGLISRHAMAGFGSERLRWLVSSGSKWRSSEESQLRLLFPAAQFAEFYGASETSFISIAHECEAAPAESVGRAFETVEITIRNPDGAILATGSRGRIFARSKMSFSGYATGEPCFLTAGDGAICVGDLGYLDDKGWLYISGREHRMIVTSGKNLFPEEVERVIETHPWIEAAAVIGVMDIKRGEVPVGLIQTAYLANVTRAELISHARTYLPLYKIPRLYFTVDEWPFTPSGKTDFAKLTEFYRSGTLRPLT